MSDNLLKELPVVFSGPGVYLMKDASGTIIYVGKARNLKKRLSSYFSGTGRLDKKTEVLVKKISTFETIITDTEKEALILESNLIKKHRPRYNVILKDGKRYPSLRLDTKNSYPFLEIVRKTKKDGAMYFGPFSSAGAVRQTVKVINKTFRLRKCKTKDFQNRSRPCLNYQMGICLGPCCHNIDETVYQEIVREVSLFLKGRAHELIKNIKKEMIEASENHEFEKAAQLRDKMFSIEKTVEKQIAVTTDFMDRDVIAIAGEKDLSMIVVLFVRGGLLLGSHRFPLHETMSSDAEIIGAFIKQYYEKSSFIPKEILTSTNLEDSMVLEEWMKDLKGEKVSISWPRRGEKARLSHIAMQNAENELKNHIISEEAHKNLLLRLQNKLGMDKIPNHIECFDNSNISGKEPVSGLVVFNHGKFERSSYRKYKLRTVNAQDDYAGMSEVLKRRFGNTENKVPLPDLLMVDGGKGQLNIAVSVTRDLNLVGRFDIIGIAKRNEQKGETEDKIYKPGRANPVNMGREGDLLVFLQRIRDEAHRFAISFHRTRRNKTSIRSALDDVPGIGKKRKEKLLKHFGSIKKIRAATLEELSALPGMNIKAAKALIHTLLK